MLACEEPQQPERTQVRPPGQSAMLQPDIWERTSQSSKPDTQRGEPKLRIVISVLSFLTSVQSQEVSTGFLVVNLRPKQGNQCGVFRADTWGHLQACASGKSFLFSGSQRWHLAIKTQPGLDKCLRGLLLASVCYDLLFTLALRSNLLHGPNAQQKHRVADSESQYQRKKTRHHLFSFSKFSGALTPTKGRTLTNKSYKLVPS